MVLIHWQGPLLLALTWDSRTIKNLQKMKKYYLYILLVLVLSGCDGFLEEEPRSFIAPSNFYQSDGDATAAAIGVYDVLTRRNMYGHEGIFVYGDIAADVAGSSPQAAFIQQGYDNYTVNADDPTLTGFYRDSYVLINRANTVIEAINDSEAISQSVKDQVVGESLFLRALTYFNLVRVFGDVVLRTESTRTLDGLKLSRVNSDDVYNQIIADLDQAENLLPQSISIDGRANGWAAKALLAKVYLTLGRFSDAAQKAREVMDAGFDLNPDFEDVFVVNPQNSEVENIFQVQFSFPNETNQFPQFFITRDLASIPGYGGNVFGVYIATNELANSYTDGDLRKDYTIWTNGERVGQSDIVFQEPGINKLISHAIENPDQPVQQSGINSFPILRYSDVLLMYAEAINESEGPSVAAYNAVNLVRNRAGLENLPEGLSREDFKDAILEERKLEFVCEGHRWFDLKRTGRLSQELSEFGFESNNEVFPIPQNVIDANEQIMQNPGY